MGNLIQTKIKTKVSSKVIVSVFLVIAGAAFGVVAFNGLVPTFFTPSNNATSIAATVESTRWAGVLGPQQCDETSAKNLILAIQAGADVKVLNINNQFQQQCAEVEVRNSSIAGTFDVFCYLSGDKGVQQNGVLEKIGWVYFNTSKPCVMNQLISTDLTKETGEHKIVQGSSFVVPILWFVKK